VKVSKLLLRDGDGLRQEAGVVVELALLAVQAESRPAGDVIGEPRQTKTESLLTQFDCSFTAEVYLECSLVPSQS
jgi:hypothetical protein